MAEKTLNLDNNSGEVQTKKILATEDKNISWEVGTSKGNSVVKGIENLPSITPNEETLEEDKAFRLELINLVKESNLENINYLKNNFTFSVVPNSSSESTLSVISDDTTPFNLKLHNNSNSKEQIYSNIYRTAIHSEMVNDTKELKFVNNNLRDIPILGNDKIEILYDVNYNIIKSDINLSDTDIKINVNKNLAYKESLRPEDVNVDNLLGSFKAKKTYSLETKGDTTLNIEYDFTPNLKDSINCYNLGGAEPDTSNPKIFKVTTLSEKFIITLPSFWFKNIESLLSTNSITNENIMKCWFRDDTRGRNFSTTEGIGTTPALIILSNNKKYGILINLQKYITMGNNIPKYSIFAYHMIEYSNIKLLKEERELSLPFEELTFKNIDIEISLNNILTEIIDDIIYPNINGYGISIKRI